MAKATAIAHTIQGLIKYHGLRDKKRRIPYHDSISVCVDKLTTKATVEFDSSYSEDIIEINGRPASKTEASRVLAVVSRLRSIAKTNKHFKMFSLNSLVEGKGLGFSASAFASISRASRTALGLNIDNEHLSEIARLGAGSASRSVVGGFSIWYANKNGRSYAKQIASENDLPFAMAVVPVSSQVKTDMAHEESVTSPFFFARLSEVKRTLPRMLRAIRSKDTNEIGKLAEADSLSLHAVTMTGKSRLLLMAPDTIKTIQLIISMREARQIPVWYSLDTGPSVFVNTNLEHVDEVCREIESNTGLRALKSGVGGPAHLSDEHLF